MVTTDASGARCGLKARAISTSENAEMAVDWRKSVRAVSWKGLNPLAVIAERDRVHDPVQRGVAGGADGVGELGGGPVLLHVADEHRFARELGFQGLFLASDRTL